MSEKKYGEPWAYCGQNNDGHLAKGTQLEKFVDASERFCSCGMIWSTLFDFPVMQVTIGKWGDQYPAIRIREPKALGAVAEPYMEMIEYGEVPVEQAEAISKRVVSLINLCAGRTADDIAAALNLWDNREQVVGILGDIKTLLTQSQPSSPREGRVYDGITAALALLQAEKEGKA